MGTVKVVAPAKVNLYLGIGQRRPDGYHDVETVMHALALHDLVTVSAQPGAAGEGLAVSVSVAEHGGVAPLDVAAEDNIAYKAAIRLAESLGRTDDEQVRIAIDKSIPHGAGLGGGSADAAAVIAGLCALWGEDPLGVSAVSVAGSLGADVAFFLYGGCARMSGAGEALEARLDPGKATLVLVRPDQGVSTGAAYRAFDEAPVSIDPQVREAMYGAVCAGDVPLLNNLAPAAESILPELAEIRAWLSGCSGVMRGADGQPAVLLCGSGSTTFAICEGFDAAYRICAEARSRGLWARTTNLSGIRAAVLR